MAKSAIPDAGRGDVFKVDPDRLYVELDESQPLYDPRVKLPISESMVKSIMVHGVIEPIVCRKNGDRIEVIDGRRRTLHAREANARLAKAGEITVKVPVILRKDDDKKAEGIGILLNEQRINDDVITRAEKAGRLLERGMEGQEIADYFGVTKAAVSTWMKLLDLSAAAKVAVRAGKISATDAVKSLADVPRGEQAEKIETLAATAPKRKRGSKGSAEKKASPVKRLRTLCRMDRAVAALTKRERILLQWFYGEVNTDELVRELPQLKEFTEALD